MSGCGGTTLTPPWPPSYFLVTLGFGALGLVDDLAGDRSVGGFRGHLGALRRGRLTTGAAKALGGGGLSLLAGYLIVADPIFWHHPGLWWRWPLARSPDRPVRQHPEPAGSAARPLPRRFFPRRRDPDLHTAVLAASGRGRRFCFTSPWPWP